MEIKNWKMKGLRDGGMVVQSFVSNISIFIQQGIARVYNLGNLIDEVDVNKMSMIDLSAWIDSKCLTN